MNLGKIIATVLIFFTAMSASPHLSLSQKARKIKPAAIPTAHAAEIPARQLIPNLALLQPLDQIQQKQLWPILQIQGPQQARLQAQTAQVALLPQARQQQSPQSPQSPQQLPPAQTQPSQTRASTPPVACDYTPPEKALYGAKILAVRKKGIVAKKEVFETQIYVQNTGNVPWFSVDSGCNNSVVSLGTEKDRDRSSPFYANALFWQSNWLSPNRIKMETARVNPQEVATFSFWSQAPDADGLYREYYAPVVEKVTWIEEGTAQMDITVGDPQIDPKTRDLLSYIEKSTNLADINLTGEKNMEVDLSEQKLWLKIGDNVIREFRVSTGKPKTPTPIGTTSIIQKSEVRVAGAAPHYIMPKWMMFRNGGFGFHALPSLANDHGVFWREALNHIGSARSHGCIRLLPQDAEFAYNFAEVGTKVVVHR
jgi:hypothetical protein